MMKYRRPITRELARDMAEAHADGYHADFPREGCPECEDRDLRSYPTQEQIDTTRQQASELLAQQQPNPNTDTGE
jgi:hypothetical protein